MLIELNVKNIALIERAHVEFAGGLNILTGETGTGKSVIIDSVLLALGARVRGDMIRTGEESAYVELIFDVTGAKAERLAALGVEPDENGLIVVSRRITPGRSISRIGDETVTLACLRRVTAELIDIYGQNEYHTLLDHSRHLELLDAFLGEEGEALRSSVREAYQDFEEARHQLADLGQDEAARAREEEMTRFELGEIDAARLRAGEEEELASEHRRLSNLRKITERLSSAYEELKSWDTARAASDIQSAVYYDEGLGPLYDEIIDMEGILDEVLSSISSYASDLDTDEQRLYETEMRLDTIRSLETKYGRTIADILEYREQAAARLVELEHFEERRLLAEQSFEKARERLHRLCGELGALRRETAAKLCRLVSEEMRELSFTDAAIDMEFDTVTASQDGTDEAVFVARLNPGEPMRPLDLIASGGELSRVMLALKTVLARTDFMPTLIFDEIDAGISGRTAQRIAEKMADIAREHQVIAVSHLPQIAAMADAHFLIEKTYASGRNITCIERLDEAGEVEELARLLGGSLITDAVRCNARELKHLADRYKEGAR